MMRAPNSYPLLRIVGGADAPGNPTPLKASSKSRRMTRASLQGQHEHMTQNCQRVQIWIRDGKYLIRARWNGQQIGITLGADENTAGHQLRRVLTEMEDGTFVSGSETRRRRLKRGLIPKHDLRGLIASYIEERRRIKGPNTADNYFNRLMHVLDFAELPVHRKKWPLARDIDRHFAIDLRTFLFRRDVTPNGRYGAAPRKMSGKMVQLCLEALRAVLIWARRPEVRQLPVDFTQPITPEIVGPPPSKDPLRGSPVPLAQRIQMVEQMDIWQLLHLSPLLILPTRFEDVAGALVSDFDLSAGTWRLGTRLGGSDYNKGHVEVAMPLPTVLTQILRLTITGRNDGPMFRSRRDWKGGIRPRAQFSSAMEFELLCHEAMAKAKPADVESGQGRKNVIRKLIRKCGAVSKDAISSELRSLFDEVGVPKHIKPYDVRAAVTTDMHHAGIPQLELRYLTMHSVSDILNEYASLNPQEEIKKYFDRIELLLNALKRRATDLELPLDTSQ